MRKFLLILLCCAAATAFGKADKKVKLDPKVKLDQKEKKLLTREKKLLKEMFELRVKLIEKDPNLKKLHDKIMELHRELALSLDSKKEMRAVSDKLKKVRISIAEIKAEKGEGKEDDTD